MKKAKLLLLVLIGCGTFVVKAQMPDTDIFMVQLGVKNKTGYTTPKNLTQRVGYDNQPAFSADGKSVLFTSIHEDGQADLYAIDLKTFQTKQLCATSESEYSPTLAPNGKGISVVRVEKDSTQRLWLFDMNGQNQKVIFADFDSVGYHCWLDSATVACFVLTEPATLQIKSMNKGPHVIASSIGRCIRMKPNSNLLTFVDKTDSTWVIKSFDRISGITRYIANTPKGSEDYAWTHDGRLYMGSGSKLMLLDPQKDQSWQEVADFSSFLESIGRIALNPSENTFIIVAKAIK